MASFILVMKVNLQHVVYCQILQYLKCQKGKKVEFANMLLVLCSLNSQFDIAWMELFLNFAKFCCLPFFLALYFCNSLLARNMTDQAPRL